MSLGVTRQGPGFRRKGCNRGLEASVVNLCEALGQNGTGLAREISPTKNENPPMIKK